MKYKAGDLIWKCPKCGREFKNTNQDHYLLVMLQSANVKTNQFLI